MLLFELNRNMYLSCLPQIAYIKTQVCWQTCYDQNDTNQLVLCLIQLTVKENHLSTIKYCMLTLVTQFDQPK